MLIGNLTRDPVLKETGNGAQVCTFGIATNDKWRTGDGEIQERTEFHNIVAWNKLAEICSKILTTGMLVYVEGQLRTRVWDDESGVRHYKTEIKIDEMKLLDDKGRKVQQLESDDNLEEVAKKEVEEEAEENKEPEKKPEQEEKKESEDEKVDEKEIEKEAEDLF